MAAPCQDCDTIVRKELNAEQGKMYEQIPWVYLFIFLQYITLVWAGRVPILSCSPCMYPMAGAWYFLSASSLYWRRLTWPGSGLGAAGPIIPLQSSCATTHQQVSHGWLGLLDQWIVPLQSSCATTRQQVSHGWLGSLGQWIVPLQSSCATMPAGESWLVGVAGPIILLQSSCATTRQQVSHGWLGSLGQSSHYKAVVLPHASRWVMAGWGRWASESSHCKVAVLPHASRWVMAGWGRWANRPIAK